MLLHRFPLKGTSRMTCRYFTPFQSCKDIVPYLYTSLQKKVLHSVEVLNERNISDMFTQTSLDEIGDLCTNELAAMALHKQKI